MARIRTIKPEFYRHHDLYTAEVEYGLPLRVAFSGLWTCADKEGRFKWKPIQLKLDVLPFDDIDFLDVLIALYDTGFIEYYEVDGKQYGFIPTFKEHQRITGSEATSESKLPSLPIDYKKGNTLETPKKPQRNNLDDREREGKGKGKGKEGSDSEENIPIIFQLEKIYSKNWDEYSATLNGQAKKTSEIIFDTWEQFVDFVKENDYHELFRAKFVNPIDFGILLNEKKFLPDKWKDTIERLLATGVTPQQNLFFRIPQFMEYGKQGKQFTPSTVGKTLEFDKP